MRTTPVLYDRLASLQRGVHIAKTLSTIVSLAFAAYVLYVVVAIWKSWWHFPARVGYSICVVSLIICLLLHYRVSKLKGQIRSEISQFSDDNVQLVDLLTDILVTSYESDLKDNDLRCECIRNITRVLTSAPAGSLGAISLQSRDRLLRILRRHKQLGRFVLTTNFAISIIGMIEARPDPTGLSVIEEIVTGRSHGYNHAKIWRSAHRTIAKVKKKIAQLSDAETSW